MRLFILLFSLLFATAAQAATITFPSKDGLTITAEHRDRDSKTIIVLFHQAGSSRGEYAEISLRLNFLGYTTLAVDQRSGGQFGGITNETAKRGAKEGKGNDFVSARPDLEAAINYARKELGAEKVIIWGSSYSAALSLVIAGTKSADVDGVLSFSPGEYLSGLSVQKAAGGISIPTLISSARSETSQWEQIYNAIPKGVPAIAFEPNGDGRHGSSALIKGRSSNADEYWQVVEAFLKAHF